MKLNNPNYLNGLGSSASEIDGKVIPIDTIALLRAKTVTPSTVWVSGYYTKGDANQQEDKGFRTQKNIVGIVKGKIPYIGKITLLLNDIINK